MASKLCSRGKHSDIDYKGGFERGKPGGSRESLQWSRAITAC